MSDGYGPSTSGNPFLEDDYLYFIEFAATTIQRHWRGYRERKAYWAKVRGRLSEAKAHGHASSMGRMLWHASAYKAQGHAPCHRTGCCHKARHSFQEFRLQPPLICTPGIMCITAPLCTCPPHVAFVSAAQLHDDLEQQVLHAAALTEGARRDTAARRIQRAWQGFRNRRIFLFYRDLIQFR